MYMTDTDLCLIINNNLIIFNNLSKITLRIRELGPVFPYKFETVDKRERKFVFVWIVKKLTQVFPTKEKQQSFHNHLLMLLSYFIVFNEIKDYTNHILFLTYNIHFTRQMYFWYCFTKE